MVRLFRPANNIIHRPFGMDSGGSSRTLRGLRVPRKIKYSSLPKLFSNVTQGSHKGFTGNTMLILDYIGGGEDSRVLRGLRVPKETVTTRSG